MSLAIVLLPDPERPTMPITSPAVTENDILFSTSELSGR
jgi:hypothetical protein